MEGFFTKWAGAVETAKVAGLVVMFLAGSAGAAVLTADLGWFTLVVLAGATG